MQILTGPDLRLAVDRIFAMSICGRNGCIVWTGHKNDSGYGKISVYGKQYRTHRIVHSVFNGNPGELCVCHSCDNRDCVNPHHLFAGTRADNLRDMREKGRDCPPPLKRGEDNGHSKLTAEDVLAIRSRYVPRSRKHGQHALARDFNVWQSTIRFIVNNETWKHI